MKVFKDKWEFIFCVVIILGAFSLFYFMFWFYSLTLECRNDIIPLIEEHCRENDMELARYYFTNDRIYWDDGFFTCIKYVDKGRAGRDVMKTEAFDFGWDCDPTRFWLV